MTDNLTRSAGFNRAILEAGQAYETVAANLVSEIDAHAVTRKERDIQIEETIRVSKELHRIEKNYEHLKVQHANQRQSIRSLHEELSKANAEIAFLKSFHIDPRLPDWERELMYNSRDEAEKELWPNRYELNDIHFIAIDGTVYFNDERWYWVDDKYNGFFSMNDWDRTRREWENNRWPNRVSLDDVYFIAKANTNDTRSWAFVGDTAYGSNTQEVYVGGNLAYWRDKYEGWRWPNRIYQDNVEAITECIAYSNCVDVDFSNGKTCSKDATCQSWK